MTLLGDRSASFIVRIWREDREDAAAKVVWRGSIESVRNGERAFFRQIAEIERFLKMHLAGIGIDLDVSHEDDQEEL